MSIEQENASNALIVFTEYLKTCSEEQFRNAERDMQQKGFHSALKYFFLEIENLRKTEEIKKLKEINREHEQRREGSTVNPEQ